MTKKILFYSYAPREYPFILRNIKQKPLEYAKHEIVDCGIMDLVKEPFQHSKEKLEKWELLELKNGWKVVPDCPHMQKEFGTESKIDNIEYSKELMKKLYNPSELSHLPVIQGYYHDPNSFREYAYWFLENYSMPKKIGIGTVCKASNRTAIAETCKIARSIFPKASIHLFGLRRQHLSSVYKYIDSYDSMSWTWARDGSGSCKNKKERIEFFNWYMETMPNYMINSKNTQKINNFFKRNIIEEILHDLKGENNYDHKIY